jgi:hypothetical protein
MLLAAEAILFRRPTDNSTKVDARIYPVGTDRSRWRVQFEYLPIAENNSDWSSACMTWWKVDQFQYAGLAVDEFVFESSPDGSVNGVSNAGLRVQFRKEI